MENNVQSKIQNTIGQALYIAKAIACDCAEKQQEFLISYLVGIAENEGRSALASKFMEMSDPNFKLDWKAIYAELDEDEMDDDSECYVKFSQAVHDGMFPIHVMDGDLMEDSESRDALVRYVMTVGNAAANVVPYAQKATLPRTRYLSYSAGSGITITEGRGNRKPVFETPRGHIALSGCETLADLYARSICITRWAHHMAGILRKATKKRRFSASVQEQVDTLIKVLNTVRKIDTTDGDGYELRLLSNERARQLTLAVDSLDACAVSEIREALIRYALGPTSDCDSGSGRRKIKKHLKENGVLLSEDLLRLVIKSADLDGDAASIWESIALLDVVGVARSYVRKCHLVDDSVNLEANWLELDTGADNLELNDMA